MGFELTTLCGDPYEAFLGLWAVLPFALGVAFVRYAGRGRRLIALDLNA